MGDLITLICPSCGGKLQVGQNTTVLNCQHCGIEHLVRKDSGGASLEFFARCPNCGRNDRVEKVSAILRSHKQEVTTTEKHTETYIDQNGQQQTRTIEVPVTTVQFTGLAKSFIPPGDKPEPIPKPNSLPKPNALPKPPNLPRPMDPKPTLNNPNSEKKTQLLAGSILIAIPAIYFIIALASHSSNDSLICGIPLLILLIPGIAFLISGIMKKPLNDSEIEIIEKDNEKKLQVWREKNEQLRKKWENENEQLLRKWQTENEQAIHTWQQDNEKLINKWQEDNWLLEESWQKAMENWNNLYYCHRDDCVFVQGDDSYAPIDEMENYLYKDLPKADVSLYYRSAQ